VVNLSSEILVEDYRVTDLVQKPSDDVVDPFGRWLFVSVGGLVVWWFGGLVVWWFGGLVVVGAALWIANQK
jgi:hypothetical protein